MKGELSSTEGGESGRNDDVLELSRALDNLYTSSVDGSGGYSAVLSKTLASSPNTAATSTTTTQKQAAPSETESLTCAASFDDRLALVESAMGISGPYNPFLVVNDDSTSRSPILPSLDRLSSRLSVLTSIFVGSQQSNSNLNLEVLEMRVKKLSADAEALDAARKQRANEATGDIAADEMTAAEEQNAKIQSLYATLPTIQSMYPLLPNVLERLRSLRVIHAGAAQAAESLDMVEQRQMETDKEIQQWREALTVVEDKMRQGETAMKNNINVVEPWVRDLEARLRLLENGA